MRASFGKPFENLKTESIVKLDAKAHLSRLKSIKQVFLPAMIQHNKKIIARVQYPAEPTLKPDVAGVGIILKKIRQSDERRKGIIQPEHYQACVEIPLFQSYPVLLQLQRRGQMAVFSPGEFTLVTSNRSGIE